MQTALGAGSEFTNRLLARFRSPDKVYAADAAAYKAIGLRESQYHGLLDKSLQRASYILQKTLASGCWVITPDDHYFPEGLRNIDGIPLVLYGRGEMPNLQTIPAIAMVGTRRCTRAGVDCAGYLAESVAKGGAIVVSGGAIGIDAACHAGALEAGGITVAVQGCGLDINYPTLNETLRRQILQRGGAILSEYPFGTRATKQHFRPRNRLISGMCVGTCVVEAPRRSGALITANFAREQGKDVFAVPGSIFSYHSAGCNRLIRQGAILVDSGADILTEYESRFPGVLDIEAAQSVTFIKSEPAKRKRQPKTEQPDSSPASTVESPVERQPLPAGATDQARTLYERLTATPQAADDLADALQWQTSAVLSVLTELEIYGVAQSHPGKLYSIKG